MTIVEKITNHSIIFGEPVFKEFIEISTERLDHVIKLIKSELNELKAADTMHEQKDGCGDVLWTIIRAFQEHGVNFKGVKVALDGKFIPFLTSINKIEVLLHELRHTAVGEESVTNVLNELFTYAVELFKPLNYDIEYIMDKVYHGNMSKLCKTEEEAKETVKAYAEGTHPNKMGKVIITHYKKAKTGFVVYRTADNKYLKSINFVEPKF